MTLLLQPTTLHSIRQCFVLCCVKLSAGHGFLNIHHYQFLVMKGGATTETLGHFYHFLISTTVAIFVSWFLVLAEICHEQDQNDSLPAFSVFFFFGGFFCGLSANVLSDGVFQ